MSASPPPTPKHRLTYWYSRKTARVNRCMECGIRIRRDRHRANFPICLGCFLKRCKRIERETGMVVGWGPASNEVFRAGGDP